MKTYRIKIPSITCASCTGSLEGTFRETLETSILDLSASVNAQKLKVVVPDHVSWPALRSIVEDAGHEVDLLQTTENDKPIAIDPNQTPRTLDSTKWYWIRALLGGAVGIPFFILCLIGMSIPLYGMIIMAAITLPVLLFTGYEIFRRAFYDLKKARKITMDSLFSVSSIVSFIVSIIGIAIPSIGLPMFFEAAILIIAFRNLGIAIERKAKAALNTEKKFLDATPEDLLINKKWLSDYVVGETIVIGPGSLIPLDGIVLEGEATVHQTVYSGDQHPARVLANHEVFAGMKVQKGQLTIQVTATRQDSLLARLDRMREQAEDSKPKIEAIMNKVVKGFVPTVIAISLLSLAFVAAFVSPITAISTFVSVLSVACPCVFGWLVPLSLQVAIRKAADHQIFVAKHQAMQAIHETDTVIFDITGTLTKPMITEVVSSTPDELLSLANRLEQGSQHVIAHAVRQFTGQPPLDPALESTAEDYLGLGRHLNYRGEECCIGDERLMNQLQIDYSPYQAALEALHRQGKTALFVVRAGKILGYLVQEYQLKADALQTIYQLRQRGIKRVKISTGSHRVTALAIAKRLKIPAHDVRYEQTPEQKMMYVQQMQVPHHAADLQTLYQQPDSPQRQKAIRDLLAKRRHVVAYVGDAGNDAAAMAASDVSFAMSSGDLICKGRADVVLPDHSLMPLANSVGIAHQVMRNIKINLALTIAFNLVMIAIAAGVLIPVGMTLMPALAAAFMIGEAVVVLISVLIFKHLKVPTVKSPEFLGPSSSLDLAVDSANLNLDDEALLQTQPTVRPSPVGAPWLSFGKHKRAGHLPESTQSARLAEFDQSEEDEPLLSLDL